MSARRFSVTELPTHYYADASHPLKEGRREMAEERGESKSFQAWMRESSGGAE